MNDFRFIQKETIYRFQNNFTMTELTGTFGKSRKLKVKLNCQIKWCKFCL